MGKIGDYPSSFEEATTVSRDLQCLFCGQSLARFRNHHRDRKEKNKRKGNGSSRKRMNKDDTSSSSGGRAGGVSSKETLFGGMEVMRRTLQFQVESVLPREDACDNVSVEEACCNECFTKTEKLVKLQNQIDTLEASKLELVQLLQTLIVKSEPWRKAQFVTNTNPDPWSFFSEFRQQVSKNLPKLQIPILKIERETIPPPTDDESTICEDFFAQPCNDDFVNQDQDIGASSQMAIQTDMQPVVKLERTDLALFTDADIYLNHNVSYEKEDDANVGGLSPTDSPIINYDDEPESDDSYQPEEPRKKKRIDWSSLKRGKLTAVGYQYVEKRKRGRPRKVRPSSADNTTVDNPPKRRRGRPRREKEVLADDASHDYDVTEKRKRGRPSKFTVITPIVKETNEVISDASKGLSDGEDVEFQPMDTCTKKNRKSRIKSQKLKAETDSHHQQHSTSRNIIDDSSDKWKEDPSAFYPVYALNQSQGEYMFLFVKFKITPTSFLCQHPNCSEEGRFVGHFTEQTAFLMQRLHIRKQHRVGVRNQFQQELDAIAPKYYYCCCHCQLQLESMSEMTEHCEDHHEGAPSPLAVCEVCGFTTAEENLIEHIITHKSAIEKELVKELPPGRSRQASRPFMFPCDECDKIFRNTTELRTHRVKHVPAEQRRQHICDLCGELYMSENMLKSHISQVHFKHKLDRPYQCPYCASSFSKNKKHSYEDHVRSHTGEKPFQCEQCGKGFGSKQKYKMHMDTHVYEPIPCQYCSQLYKTKKGLRTHHIKHHPDLMDWSKVKQKSRTEYYGPALMHPCEPCGHLYRYKSALVAHMKHKHKMQLERNADYPSMWTWEDDRGSGWSEGNKLLNCNLFHSV